MSTRAAVWAAVAAVALGATACSEATFEGGAPVRIDLTADRTSAKVGQNITFTFNAYGSILDGVIVAYGDGIADTLYTAGAMSARGQFLHAYENAGTFTAVGTVWDGRQGPASDTLVIQITGS